MPHITLSKTVKVFRLPVILAVLAAGLLPISNINAQSYTRVNVRYTNVNVRPPIIVETPGGPPRRGLVWSPGHWRWSKKQGNWVWVRGHWAKR